MKRLTLMGASCATLMLLAGCATQVATSTTQDTSSQVVTAPATTAFEVLSETPQLAHYRLANGLEVIVKPDRRAPTAINMLWVRVGSIDEVDGNTGIAHVLEHMMFKGSKTLAPGEFSRRVSELGGQDNAFTSKDYTGYYQQVPSEQLAAVMALEADRFQHNEWPDEEFTRELEVVKEERRSRIDDQPRSKMFEQMSATAFLASPWRRPIIGWMNDLDRLTANEARDFYRHWYVPANAAVVVVGNVEPRDVLQLAQQYYGSAPAAAVPDRHLTQEPVQQGPRRMVLRDRGEQPLLAMAYKVPTLQNLAQPSETDRDALALMALEGVLSGYDGARLERSLARGTKRVADSVGGSAMISGRSGAGLFYVTGVPATGHTTAQLEAGIRQVITDVAKNGIDATELKRVTTQWSAETIYGQDSMYAQASDLGNNWILGWPLNSTERLIDLLREVTPAQVQSVAQRYFSDDSLTVAELEPQRGNPASAPSAAINAPQGAQR